MATVSQQLTVVLRRQRRAWQRIRQRSLQDANNFRPHVAVALLKACVQDAWQ